MINKNKMEAIMKKEMVYKPPVVVIHRVAMEKNIAQVAISAHITVDDWEDEGTVIGTEPDTQGGDIYLY